MSTSASDVRRLGIACAFVSALVPAAAEEALRSLSDSELQREERVEMAVAGAWQLPAGVSFMLDGPAQPETGAVRLTGWLTNTADESRRVIVFPMGTDGFLVRPVAGTATRRPGAAILPSAPPPPLALTSPPRSRYRQEALFAVDDWVWPEGQAKEVEWAFLFWNEPRPRGRLMLP